MPTHLKTEAFFIFQLFLCVQEQALAYGEEGLGYSFHGENLEI